MEKFTLGGTPCRDAQTVFFFGRVNVSTHIMRPESAVKFSSYGVVPVPCPHVSTVRNCAFRGGNRSR